MDSPSLQKIITEMQEFIARQTAMGLSGAEDIIADAVEVFTDDCAAETLEPIAERLTREAVVARKEAEQSWPPETDCDLLDRAFAELNRAGITARHHFTCCGT